MFYQRATTLLSPAQIRAVLVAIILLSVNLGLAGCAGGNRVSPPSSASSVNTGSASRDQASATRAANIAQQQVGIPYRYGGADISGFDCSGLVYYAYSNAGVRVARTTRELWRTLQPVAKDKLQVGDILFFDIEGKMSHVGLYVGRGRFVHSPSSGKNVMITDLDSVFYRRALIRGGRAY